MCFSGKTNPVDGRVQRSMGAHVAAFTPKQIRTFRHDRSKPCLEIAVPKFYMIISVFEMICYM